MTENASSYNPTPVVYEDRLYTLWDFGFLSCLNARTGAEVYEKQRIRPDGVAGFTSSPWVANGKIFCLSEDGDTYVFKAGDEFELLRVNSLEELCMATPALVGDRLVVRTQSRLISIKDASR
jgi:outer membrane protein assembly factor BamB